MGVTGVVMTDRGPDGWHHHKSYDGELSVAPVEMHPIDTAYTLQGEYYGVGEPLFRVESDLSDRDTEIDYVFRAPDMVTALETVQARYPLATVCVG